MSRARVYADEGAWWAVLPCQGWEDATPFDDWEDALDHASWLVWCAKRATTPTRTTEHEEAPR